MVLLWTLFILLVLALLICFSILRFQALQVEKRREILMEALWARRNRIPLLLDILKQAGIHFDKRQAIIDLRSKLLSQVYTLEEQIEWEKELSQHMKQVPILKSETVFLSLQKELGETLESIRIAINDYNFELQKWQKYMSLPWFKIFEFGFEIRKNKSLAVF
jgi:hypothetical protein